MSSNYISVTSPEHFKQLLSQDLDRLSVLNFRAEWAAPCAQMDGVAKELAGKHPQALFLEVRDLPLDMKEAVLNTEAHRSRLRPSLRSPRVSTLKAYRILCS